MAFQDNILWHALLSAWKKTKTTQILGSLHTLKYLQKPVNNYEIIGANLYVFVYSWDEITLLKIHLCVGI